MKLPLCLLLPLGLITTPMLSHGQLGGNWVPEGPGPTTNGQVEGVVDGEVVGAVNSVATHPTDADIAYIGGVNGGIWMTSNATAANPNWTPQLDDQNSLSIGSIEFDPTDATNNTLVAGIGRFSSLGGRGGQRLGMYRTTDGGANWTFIDGGGALTGRNIKGIAARGNVIVIAVNAADGGNPATETGIFRSDDTGATWTQLSVGDGTGPTGLPAGVSFDLTSDPSDNNRLYTNIIGPLNSGVFRSDDAGATWTRVSNAAIEGLLDENTTNNLEMAVGAANNPYLLIVDSGRAAGVFRSGDGGANWQQMDLPIVGTIGIHPGGQGSIHTSITADRTNANIVYVSGDRQDFAGNIIGATDFSGRPMRGDASQPSGSQWVHLSHRSDLGPAGGGTANASAPHADSRDMAMAADGVLIEADDGGVYRRTSPLDDTGDWQTMNGDLQTTEFHSTRYDQISGILIGGTQDTGTPEQISTMDTRWRSVSTADGGQVLVDNNSLAGMSVRYSSNQFLGGFRRRVIDINNNVVSTVFPPRTPLDGAPPVQAQFYTPIELNSVNPLRMIFGGGNGIYESLDQGNTVSLLDDMVIVTQVSGDPIAYGATNNEEILYAGSGDEVFVRTAANPAPLVSSAAFPGAGSGSFVRDIVIRRNDAASAFVINNANVFMTTNTGASWTDITNNLGSFNFGILRSMVFIENPVGNALIVAAQSGIFMASESDGFSTWTDVGDDLPTVPIYALEYNADEDLLIAGTLGRGAWTLTPTMVDPDLVFSNGFEGN